MTKNIYAILGVARSGTSVIAKALDVLGIDLGDKLVPAGRWNPKGYWEDDDIVYKVNQRLLTVLNYKWDCTRLINKEELTQSNLNEVRQTAMELLNQRLAITQHWGFKDPRTVRILPFWKSIFNQLNLSDHYLIALRNPLASAQSFRKLTGADIEKGLLLWLMHLLPAIDETQGKSRLVVSYERIMQDPRLQLERIRKNLQLNIPLDENKMEAYINKYIDKSFHHYEYSDTDLKSHPASAVTPLCLKTYDLLLKLSRDEVTFDSQEFLQTWQEIKNEFEKIYPVYVYIDSLQQQKVDLEKELHRIHKTWIWKMLYPVRKIKDVFRAKRIQRKQARLMRR